MKDISLFPARFADIMKEKNVNQSELSRKTGISNQAISNWLAGKSEPLVSFVWRLADFFDCSVDYLIGRSDY